MALGYECRKNDSGSGKSGILRVHDMEVMKHLS